MVHMHCYGLSGHNCCRELIAGKMVDIIATYFYLSLISLVIVNVNQQWGTMSRRHFIDGIWHFTLSCQHNITPMHSGNINLSFKHLNFSPYHHVTPFIKTFQLTARQDHLVCLRTTQCLTASLFCSYHHLHHWEAIGFSPFKLTVYISLN